MSRSAAFTLNALMAVLERHLPQPATRRYCVAYSGGLDSTSLLHAMAELRGRWPRSRLRALHVDHGLYPDAPQWAEHCRGGATRLAVPFEAHAVCVDRGGGKSLEAAAREARYGLLRARLAPEEVLLTAHHADDQVETVLLQLLRGAGPAGLAGMPPAKPFGSGWHLRPMLEWTRTELEAYAQGAGLAWLEEPGNLDPRFDRNFLRLEILPRLRSRWPSLAASVGRSARHSAGAGVLADDLARLDADVAARGEALSVESLSVLSPLRQRNLLRFWMRQRGLSVPSTRRLGGIVSSVVQAGPQATPHVSWAGGEVRRYRDDLHFMSPLQPAPDARARRAWPDLREPLELEAGCGRLCAVACRGGGMAAELVEAARVEVGFRRGGERVRVHTAGPRRALKKLFQETAVLPWMRARIPLVFVDGRLAAVADLWVAAEFAADSDQPGYQLRWEQHPPLR